MSVFDVERMHYSTNISDRQRYPNLADCVYRLRRSLITSFSICSFILTAHHKFSIIFKSSAVARDVCDCLQPCAAAKSSVIMESCRVPTTRSTTSLARSASGRSQCQMASQPRSSFSRSRCVCFRTRLTFTFRLTFNTLTRGIPAYGLGNLLRRAGHCQGHVTSSVTSPMDSAHPLSYRLPIVTNPVSPVVSEILSVVDGHRHARTTYEPNAI